ncbi:hypothetical protein K505DRAFT_259494 [Melanomma pulvis-pyrius CBS 109.77]|uniref:SET domain-containing protein n=1 Tax=Melanomma pulvis-pyrius CBS 109.77 TaxID=1314802 RepID=A0A6A6WRQ8_9PLEO|nr:hypothetical protein K505DRAFT_259494 [Melanomma pulvis-pyrius CBS 109.77]
MAARDPSPTSSARSAATGRAGKQSASRSSMSASPPTSTPPTSHGDEASVASEMNKTDRLLEPPDGPASPPTPADAHATPLPASAVAPASEGRRSARSSRSSVVTYNVQILAGTAIHTPSKYLHKHHQEVLHGPIDRLQSEPESMLPPTLPRQPHPEDTPDSAEDTNDSAEEQLAIEAAQAAQRHNPPRAVDLRKEALRNLSAASEVIVKTLAGGKDFMKTMIRRSASDSHLVNSARQAAPRGPGRPRTARPPVPEHDTSESEEDTALAKLKGKEWLKAGLYVGQHRDFDARLSESQNRLKRKSVSTKENKVIPLPMFAGERLLKGNVFLDYRDFKLPYDTYNPLPRKVKVDGWAKLRRNRFIGSASALWKREKQDNSSCYCFPDDGCGEDCHNRIMAYECDSTNCKLTPEQCRNRPFSELKRRAKGNGYDYGVEVLQTGDRGYGVRAMRTFEPHQVIVEYAGEIITQDECERRMKQIYKKDKCYYLMSFDNKMIIDATRGTIARFVNHSCEPNCEMIKWTVSGEPRMALFAGSRGIMTGEELTYDYNFDPFSSKNIQECRCGTPSCRGVLGPKPKKPIQEERSLAATLLAGTKRKFSEVFGSRPENDGRKIRKKRKPSSIATAVLTRAQNAEARKKAARENALKSAAELHAQRASRQNRAMNRSVSEQLSSRKSKVPRKGTRVMIPKLRSTRLTTVGMKRKQQRSLSNPSRISTLGKHNPRVPKFKKPLPAKATKSRKPLPKSPSPDPEVSEVGENESPNITPNSLRSSKLKQTTLPFKPLKLNVPSSSDSSQEVDAFETAEEEEEEEEDDEYRADDENHDDDNNADSSDEFTLMYPSVKARYAKYKHSKAYQKKSLHKTGAGVKKTTKRTYARRLTR